MNGFEAHNSSAVFPGDIIETKPGSSASLSLDGSTVLLAPESVSKFQGSLLELDHGAVSVTSSREFRVRVNCIVVVPTQNDWTQYAVTDLTGTVQVSAKKLDVNVEHELSSGKQPSPTNAPSERASVHEGEQQSYNETDVCGALVHPTSPMSGISPKWIAGGAAGAGGLIGILVFRGGNPKPQVSPSTP